jgi:hypothetical protein
VFSGKDNRRHPKRFVGENTNEGGGQINNATDTRIKKIITIVLIIDSGAFSPQVKPNKDES